MTEVVYGPHPVREALRGRREVARVWCTRRGRARRSSGCPSGVAVEAAERLAELAGSEDHQGVVAEVAPYPYADADRGHGAASGRWSSRSTRSPTRTTWAPWRGSASAPAPTGW